MIRKIFVVDKGGYCISAAGSNISTNQIVRDVRIQISEQEYTTNLVILSGLGIDVILGMNWRRTTVSSSIPRLEPLC